MSVPSSSGPQLRHIANLWSLVGYPPADEPWPLARQIESTEIADYPAGNHLGATLRAWCTLPEAFFAQAWYEVIGRKPIL